MKKYLAALLAAVMLLITAGCSSEELGMLSLINEMSQLNAVETSGTLTVASQGEYLDEMLQSMDSTDALKEVVKAGFEIRYDLKESKNPLGFKADIEFRKKGDAVFSKVTTLILDEKSMYIKLGELMQFIRPYVKLEEADEKIMDEIVSKVDYIKLDMDGTDTGYSTNSPADIVQNEKTAKLVSKFRDMLTGAFKNFSTGKVTKKNSGYELMVEAKDIPSIISGLTKYVYDNIDSMVEEVSDKINALTDEDMQIIQEAYPYTEVTRGSMISELEQMRDSIKSSPPWELDSQNSDPSLAMALNSFDGSYIKYYIGKSGYGSYDVSTDIKIKYGFLASFEITETERTTALGSFSAEEPSDFITTDQLKHIINSMIPSRLISVSILEGTGEARLIYSDGKITKTKIPLIQKGGSNYIPLNAVSDAFGETSGWDASTDSPYIYLDGEKVEMQGFVNRGVSYVKVRDLEKINYWISYDRNSKEINIVRYTNESFFEQFRNAI